MNATIEMTSSAATPLQHTSVLPFMSDKQLALFVPVVIYWLYSGFYHLVSTYEIPLFEKYRLHSLIEVETRNKVSQSEVIRAVLLQQFLQTILGLLLVVVEDEDALLDDVVEKIGYQQMLASISKTFVIWDVLEPFHNAIVETLYWFLIPFSRFLFAILHAPYAFGALYNHPVEGFVMDSVGAGLAFKLSGMTTLGGMTFFGFATFKTGKFGHDIHHQTYGTKMNYSQPFFTIWDRILGTYLSESPKVLLSTGDKYPPQTIAIHSLTLKDDGMIDEPRVHKMQRIVSVRDSPIIKRKQPFIISNRKHSQNPPEIAKLSLTQYGPPNIHEKSQSPNLIILHGLFGSKQNWKSLAKTFAQRLNTHVFTLVFATIPHLSVHNYEVMADDVAAFIKEHKLNKTVVMGHSMGGRVAMAMALRQVPHIEKLVVVDSAPISTRMPPNFSTYIDVMKKVEQAGVVRLEKADKIMEDYITVDHGTGLFKFRIPLDILGDSLETLSGFPFDSAHHTFHKKTLFIAGTKSNYLPPKVYTTIRTFFPNAVIAELDAGHWVHSEKPLEFMTIVTDFLL
ncbi:455_t:CDS:2 [Funneliformis geosporum]|nr:455_t:CDS:2 [Funneliformis geosporum]